MADVSIFNLPPMAAVLDPADVIPFTDVSDHIESPQGTTKKMLVSQLLSAPSFTAPVVISGVSTQLVINATPAPQLPTLAWQQVGVQWGGIQWLAAGTMSIFNQVSAEVARFTQGNLVLNGSITAASASRIGDPTGTAIVTLGAPAPSADAALLLNIITTNAFNNWQISTNAFASGRFAITPSTALGGSTFTTPAFTLSPNGNAAFTGALFFTGLSAITADSSGNVINFNSNAPGVGPIVRFARSAATVRTWQQRLEVGGEFSFVDETAGAVRIQINQAGILTGFNGVYGIGSPIPGLATQGSAGAGDSYIWLLNGTGGVGHYNWAIGKSFFVANALSFGVSTAPNVTTWVEKMTLSQTGVLTLAGDLTAVGGNVSLGPTTIFGSASITGVISVVGNINVSGTSGGLFVPNSSAVLIANGGSATTNRYMQFVNAGNNVLIGIETNAGSTLLAGASPYAFVMGPSVAASLQLFTSNTLRLTFDAVGVCFIGPTNVLSALGAATGEIVIGNGKSLKGSNNAVNNTIPMIAIDSFDHIVLGGGTPQTLVRIGQVAPASMPAGSVNNTGGIMVDTTNNRLCYWSGGSRYFIPIGTIF